MTTTELKLEKNKARAEKTLTKNVIQFKKRFINLNQVSDNSENYLLAMISVTSLLLKKLTVSLSNHLKNWLSF